MKLLIVLVSTWFFASFFFVYQITNPGFGYLDKLTLMSPAFSFGLTSGILYIISLLYLRRG